MFWFILDILAGRSPDGAHAFESAQPAKGSGRKAACAAGWTSARGRASSCRSRPAGEGENGSGGQAPTLIYSRQNRRDDGDCDLRGLAAMALTFAAGAAAQPERCRCPSGSASAECLEGFVDKYLQAMADGTVDPALFAPTARFTENGIELPLGNEGLWATTSAVGRYKLYVPDVETQQVAFLGTVMEAGVELGDRLAARTGGWSDCRCGCGSWTAGSPKSSRSPRGPSGRWAPARRRACSRCSRRPGRRWRRWARRVAGYLASGARERADEPGGPSGGGRTPISRRSSATRGRTTTRSPTTACGSRTA